MNKMTDTDTVDNLESTIMEADKDLARLGTKFYDMLGKSMAEETIAAIEAAYGTDSFNDFLNDARTAWRQYAEVYQRKEKLRERLGEHSSLETPTASAPPDETEEQDQGKDDIGKEIMHSRDFWFSRNTDSLRHYVDVQMGSVKQEMNEMKDLLRDLKASMVSASRSEDRKPPFSPPNSRSYPKFHSPRHASYPKMPAIPTIREGEKYSEEKLDPPRAAMEIKKDNAVLARKSATGGAHYPKLTLKNHFAGHPQGMLLQLPQGVKGLSRGGGFSGLIDWGTTNPDAFSFSVSAPVRFFGVGLYGGQGEYSTTLKLYRMKKRVIRRIGVTETRFVSTSKDIVPVLLKKPVVLQPGVTYTVLTRRQGPLSYFRK